MAAETIAFRYQFSDAISSIKHVQENYSRHVSGSGPGCCFILKVAVRDMAHLEQVTDRFTSFGQLTTSILLTPLLEGRIIENIAVPSPRKASGKETASLR